MSLTPRVKWEEAEAKRAADKARREKEAEEKHKAKVLEQLRIDKLNREAAKVRHRPLRMLLHPCHTLAHLVAHA